MNRIPNSENSNVENPRVSLAGSLLVAAPWLADSVFARSVCIVVEHSPTQTIGILLNRPLEMDTAPLFEQLLEGADKPDNVLSHVNFGGPQSGPVLAIHDNEQLAEGGNNQGVYLSAQSELLKKIAQSTPNHCRLFIGHAVWKPSQLETEIINGHWYVLPAVPDLVFADEQNMWALGVQTVGNSIVRDITGLKQSMLQPTLN